MWSSEAEFVKSFLSTINFIIHSNKNDYEVWTEVRTGFGRPDIVVIEFDSKVLNKRSECDQESLIVPLSTKTAFALSYLSTCRWLRKENLGKFLNVTNKQLDLVVQELQARGLIETKEHLIKLRPKSEVLAVKRVRVFEAKLTHWMEAIEQAERHLWFTNDSYILMPEVSGKRVTSITNECNKRGIGLGFFNEDKGFSTVLKPAQSGVQNSPMLWQINEKLVGGIHEREPVFS
jgi:glycerol-3-phosphate responsive antiterminator